MRSIRRTLAIAAVASLVLGACTNDDGTDADASTDATDADDGTVAEDDGDHDGAAPGGTVEITDASLTDDEANVTLAITSIEVQDAAVIITAEAFNRSGSRHLIIAGHEMVKLFDDQGGDYTWVPPEEGADFLLEAGDEASFTWAFRGAPRPGATSFLLTINHWPGPDGDPMRGAGQVPFRFQDLPMPGVTT